MRVAVIGHGRMGRNHSRVLRELGHTVVTVDPVAPATLQDDKIPVGYDVTCIAVPIPKLADCAERALRLGMDVLVEKPGAATAAELAELHALARDRGRKLFVGYVERHNPVLAALRKHLHMVGRIRHVGFRRLGLTTEGGDPLLDLATHDLDLLAGHRVAVAGAAAGPGHVSALLLEYSGVTISLQASHLHPMKVRTIEVVGEAGVLQVDYQAQTLGFVSPDTFRVALGVEKCEPLRAEWEAFAAGEGSDGLGALELVEQLRTQTREELPL